ncbi:MBL fold metallo-hydrolase [Mesorhizobium sp. BH1-1-4]|uniref:MBL fold metallo-hydrolase n=1 Tax=Mesorhizobium sp. BH1-1-4 TaxID=2876662 RepID=UPI001CD082DF|nr:MBL fold metallo-hydrolase [Mesorhizobium sp. BH1-1-4]MBZ9994095.1 MBL fold metallo-hydrolase [Mesorhizobium sp. BH1-1-4]
MARAPRKKPARSDDIVVYALDMGDQMYGDCLLVTSGNTKVLIDGGHSKDFDGQPGYMSIPQQLETVLGPRPFEVSLLVVTHCHSDHIGALPDMVSSGMLKASWALVADEKLGFGRAIGDDPNSDASLSFPLQGVLAALREEDRSQMDAAELADFLTDAATLESRYKDMLGQLEDAGTKVVRYGRDDHGELVAAFGDLDLNILGPTQDHLLICAEAISKSTKAAKDELSSRFRADSPDAAIQIYRALSQAPWDAVALLDRPGKGAAINNQSIILTIGTGPQKTLLVGDMQLAKPEVTGLGSSMVALRTVIADAGPYQFFKLPHHSSYNGANAEVLAAIGSPKFLVHTGGRNDGGHPDKGVLKVLSDMIDDIQFARTDRNGLIKYELSGKFTVEGELNDFSPNASRDIQPEVRESQGQEPLLHETEQEPEFLEFVYVKVPNKPLSFSLGGVPITIGGKSRGPFDEGLPVNGKPDPASLQLAGGRHLPDLLFVTNSKKLAANVGLQEAQRAIGMVVSAGHRLLDIDGERKIEEAVRKNAVGRPGVVLLGGYDVVPSQRVDVLDPDLRRRVGNQVSDDPDEFIVWSDDIYGDTDGDGLAEVPVTRIPDGRSSQLLLAILGGSQTTQAGRFGLINRERPFARAIWPMIGGRELCSTSGPDVVAGLDPAAVAKRNLYFMLHGDFADGSRFWGESGGAIEAINVSKLPASGPGLVFAGCCWGALTVDQLASRTTGALGVKTPGQSMALSLLKSGANAFVGSTGAHYSPGEGEDCFGAPMHKAFWTRINAGDPPATALYNARKAYLAALPHGLSQPYHVAIERKIYRQFTCLGLAW